MKIIDFVFGGEWDEYVCFALDTEGQVWLCRDACKYYLHGFECVDICDWEKSIYEWDRNNLFNRLNNGYEGEGRRPYEDFYRKEKGAVS